jgi:hypothetical protein
MKFRVIEGGLSAAGERQDGAGNGWPDHADVRREAERRLGACGYHRSRVMELSLGLPMPSALRYLAMQIEFAAEAICRLDPIPADFHKDLYWPKLGSITTTA